MSNVTKGIVKKGFKILITKSLILNNSAFMGGRVWLDT